MFLETREECVKIHQDQLSHHNQHLYPKFLKVLKQKQKFPRDPRIQQKAFEESAKVEWSKLFLQKWSKMIILRQTNDPKGRKKILSRVLEIEKELADMYALFNGSVLFYN